MKHFYSCSKEALTFDSAFKMTICPFCKEWLNKPYSYYDFISCQNCHWRYDFGYGELSFSFIGKKTFRKRISNLNDKSLQNILNNLIKKQALNIQNAKYWVYCQFCDYFLKKEYIPSINYDWTIIQKYAYISCLSCHYKIYFDEKASFSAKRRTRFIKRR